MKQLLLALAVLLASVTLASAATPTPTGLWLSKKGDVAVAIKPCGAKFCGTVVWLRDEVNPIGANGKPLCGTEVLSDFAADPKDANSWIDGSIYVADKGTSYSGQLHLTAPDRMELRGYLGTPLVGKTKLLRRVDAAAYPACTVSPAK